MKLWKTARTIVKQNLLSEIFYANIRNLSFLILTLFLSACSSFTMTGSDQQPELNNNINTIEQQTPLTWSQRQAQLTKIHTWQLKGAIGVQTQDKAESASVNWKQTGNRYSLRLFGPVGIGNTIITGSPQGVSLLNADRQRFYAKTASSLLAQQTGWRLPVENLVYWVRGIPAPGQAYSKNLDSENRLMTLKQSGWVVQYTRYRQNQGIELPQKMTLIYPKLKVKLVINQWRL